MISTSSLATNGLYLAVATLYQENHGRPKNKLCNVVLISMDRFCEDLHFFLKFDPKKWYRERNTETIRSPVNPIQFFFVQTIVKYLNDSKKKFQC